MRKVLQILKVIRSLGDKLCRFTITALSFCRIIRKTNFKEGSSMNYHMKRVLEVLYLFAHPRARKSLKEMIYLDDVDPERFFGPGEQASNFAEAIRKRVDLLSLDVPDWILNLEGFSEHAVSHNTND